MLWGIHAETDFFQSALKNFASPEQLFYKINGQYFAYVPKGISADGVTLQSRNSLIGKYTEKWCKNLFEPIATELGLYAVNGVVCDEIGLSNMSNADLAFCSTPDVIQKPHNIKLIFEIKMSIVSNYEYRAKDTIIHLGDYKTHKGNPSILRSDSMLKAIGKSINIRVSGQESKHIPILVLGNSPITSSYAHKVDFLKEAGVLQGFISLYPNPTKSEHIRDTHGRGFLTINEFVDLKNFCHDLIQNQLNYFSAMLSKKKLGEIISIANKENDDIAKAEKFLKLVNS